MCRPHLLAIALALLALPVAAQTWKDDFNRPSGTQMGPDWSETNGDMAILNNEGMGNMSVGWSKMVHTSAKGDYASARGRITLRPPSGSSGPHVALVFGDRGLRNLYTKIQDNNSNGTYDRVFFYSKDNGTSYGVGFKDVSPFTDGRVEMHITGGGDTMNVDIDTNFDGVVDTHVESSGILNFSSALGDGFAVGAFARGTYDDWEVTLPPTVGLFGSPSQLSLLTGGVQTLTIGGPPSLPGQPYLLLGSLNGTQPGIPVDGLVLPLNIDAYWFLTLTSPNQPPLQNSFGTLDGQAKAQASFTVPAMSNPAWAGAVFDHAFAVFDSGTLKVSHVSNPVSATLIP